eukprot:6678915-Pyramimonas_sp.AAC.1
MSPISIVTLGVRAESRSPSQTWPIARNVSSQAVEAKGMRINTILYNQKNNTTHAYVNVSYTTTTNAQPCKSCVKP